MDCDVRTCECAAKGGWGWTLSAGFPQAHATGSGGPGVEAAAVLTESAVQCGECVGAGGGV